MFIKNNNIIKTILSWFPRVFALYYTFVPQHIMVVGLLFHNCKGQCCIMIALIFTDVAKHLKLGGLLEDFT